MNLTFLSLEGIVVSLSLNEPLLSVDFAGADGLLTNEYSFWNPLDPKSKISPLWSMDSGSLFVKSGWGWSGVPDTKPVDALSLTGNNSAVFRLTTKRKDFSDASVKFNLSISNLVTTPTTPAVDWDGVHVFLRYQSQYNLYYASISRRDQTCIIKKKVPGGPSNNGTYYDLGSYTPHAWTSKIQSVESSIKTQRDGSVLIILSGDGKEIMRVIDDGKIGGPPILKVGAVGIRGDNAQFTFKDFQVYAI